eukprot:7388111-Prymnesium_polylepis.2
MKLGFSPQAPDAVQPAQSSCASLHVGLQSPQLVGHVLIMNSLLVCREQNREPWLCAQHTPHTHAARARTHDKSAAHTPAASRRHAPCTARSWPSCRTRRPDPHRCACRWSRSAGRAAPAGARRRLVVAVADRSDVRGHRQHDQRAQHDFSGRGALISEDQLAALATQPRPP